MLPPRTHSVDVVIVGGGPAGLSAALVLGRCTRSVIVLDSGRYRNRFSRSVGGFLTRDGIRPDVLRELAAREARGYGVRMIRTRAARARRNAKGTFTITDDAGRRYTSRKLLLATGVVDVIPRIPGLIRMYGKTVHHCPYCDAWAHRGKRLAAIGQGAAAVGLALCLRTWSTRVLACTLGEKLTSRDRRRAERNGIDVRSEPIVRLTGHRGRLNRIRFADGEDERCDALFFNTGQLQRSELPAHLHCSFRTDGGVLTDQRQCTGVPGLYLAGDADKDVQFTIVAAAEGAVAATAINRELQNEDRGESGRDIEFRKARSRYEESP